MKLEWQITWIRAAYLCINLLTGFVRHILLNNNCSYFRVAILSLHFFIFNFIPRVMCCIKGTFCERWNNSHPKSHQKNLIYFTKQVSYLTAFYELKYLILYCWILENYCFPEASLLDPCKGWSMHISGVATGGARGAECHPWQQKICQKSGKKREKSGKKEEKSRRKGKNWEGSFTLPLLTDRADYATDAYWPIRGT